MREMCSGLRRLEKTLVFFRCIHIIDLVLKYGSHINKGNWGQPLFYFIVLMGKVASVIGVMGIVASGIVASVFFR